MGRAADHPASGVPAHAGATRVASAIILRPKRSRARCPGRNSPQRCPSACTRSSSPGTAFTAPRHAEPAQWLYRIRPAARTGAFRPLAARHRAVASRRRRPRPTACVGCADPGAGRRDFVDGLVTLRGQRLPARKRGARSNCTWPTVPCRSGSSTMRTGNCSSCRSRVACGSHRARVLDARPLEIAVIPRGLRFRGRAAHLSARGYVCENFGAPLRLPDLGADRLQRPGQPARL